MFKLEKIKFNHENESQEYSFSNNTFIYGPNTVGKTALTKIIEFVLGSSENHLEYQGLENIDSVEALLLNEKTQLWIKRTIENEYFYKRTIDSEYTIVTSRSYKDKIDSILNTNKNDKFIKVYKNIFDEELTFRALSFLNFIEEKSLGDLNLVFSKVKDIKHQLRINTIMQFFFNYKNIEQIYEKKIQLERDELELKKLKEMNQDYNSSYKKIHDIFIELQLNYSGDIMKDLQEFKLFKSNFKRENKIKNHDFTNLYKISFSLSEEIKLHSFMKNQTKNMINRKEKYAHLLTTLNAIVENNPSYEPYSSSITRMINKIKEEKIILESVNYEETISKIQEEKDKIDQEIQASKAQASKLDYDDFLKKIGILEDSFSRVNNKIDTERIIFLEEQIKTLKDDIKKLKKNFDERKINEFNNNLTKKYLMNANKIRHVAEDQKELNFSVEFNPFKVVLQTSRIKNGEKEYYTPGSMSRKTHLQIFTYLSMFQYLKKYFSGFVYMPILIIDSANQPMEHEVFSELYPNIVEYAKEIEIQTIFLSKDKLPDISFEDFIDISNGLNKFHKI